MRFLGHWLSSSRGRNSKKPLGENSDFFGVGGAALAPECEAFLKQAGFPYAIGYGLTETSPLLAGSSPAKTRLRSTGKALKGISLRISSPNPGSKEGELEAKGDNISRVTIKIHSEPKKRLLRTDGSRLATLRLLTQKGASISRAAAKQ